MTHLRRPGPFMALITLLCLAAMGFAACGDDDDGGSGGSDESYVASICSASLKAKNAIDKATTGLKSDAKDEDVVKAFTGPLDDYVKAIKAAKPPSDVKSYHDSVVKA